MSFIKSASLILINKIKKNIVSNDYNLLLMKRLATTKSFANKMVFPGGALDKCDYSEDWNTFLHNYFTSTQIKGLTSENELLIYKNSKELSNIIPEIFYRICAIRETFEETGILLAKDEFHKSILINQNMLDDIMKNQWQQKVLKDGNLFIELLKSYKLFPDLFSLYEWSEWRSPSVVDRRFHTVFYMFISEIPLTTISHNEEESNTLTWNTPEELIDYYSLTKGLPAPQMSELFDMNILKSWRNVHAEAVKRQKIGGNKNDFFVIILSDGILLALPGDSRYPSDFNYEPLQMKHLSIEDISKDKYLRRTVFHDGNFVYQHNLNSLNYVKHNV